MPVSLPAFVAARRAQFLLAAAAVFTGAAILGPSAHAALPGLSCKPNVVVANGDDPAKVVAERKALRGWLDAVTASYGVTWARWGRAAGRSLTCSFNPGQNMHGWYCRARGRPCRMQNVSPHKYRPAKPRTPRIRRRTP